MTLRSRMKSIGKAILSTPKSKRRKRPHSTRVSSAVESLEQRQLLSAANELPGIPAIQSPGTSNNSPTAVISWTPVENADSYELFLRNKTQQNLVVHITGLQQAAFTVPFSLPADTYEITVTAHSASGGISSSLPHEFVQQLPGSPTVTVVPTSETLEVVGTDAGDSIRVTQNGSLLTVTNHNALVGSSLLGNIKRINITGLAGNDWLDASNVSIPVTISGGAGDDVLLGGAAADRLRGDDGSDTLRGGAGDDSLFGGADPDELFGGSNADRFLFESTDTIHDLQNEDAQVIFADSDNAAWTDAEIETVDRAFQMLHDRTGNNHLLKDPITSLPVIFQRVKSLPDDDHGVVLATNTSPEEYVEQYYSNELLPYIYNTVEHINSRTPQRRIQFADEGGEELMQGITNTVIHEIGHNWDSGDEIGRVLPELAGLWSDFEQIYEASQTNDDFASDYAKTKVSEDFSETFAEYFKVNRKSSPKLRERYAILDALFEGLRNKTTWDGRFEPQTESDKYTVDAFFDWLKERNPKTDIPALLKQLDPGRLADLMPFMNRTLPFLERESIAAALPHVDPAKVADVVEQLESSRLRELNGTTIAENWNAAGEVTVTWSRAGRKLLRESWQSGNRFVREVWSGGGKVQSHYKDGRLHLRKTWKKGGKFVKETWKSNGETVKTWYKNGRKYLRKTWTRGGRFVKETWNSSGTVVKTWFKNGKSYLRKTWKKGDRLIKETWSQSGKAVKTWYKKGRKYLRHTWKTGNRFVKETWNSSGRVKTYFKNGKSYLRKTWKTRGRYIKETWNSSGKAVKTYYKYKRKYLRKTWKRGNRFVLESWSRSGKAVKTYFKNGQSYLRKTWQSNGKYVRETWNSAGHYSRSIYKKGRLISRNTWNAAGKSLTSLRDHLNRMLGA